MDFEADSGKNVDGFVRCGLLEGKVEVAGAGLGGGGFEDGCRGGSLPGRGGVGIEVSADMM